MYFATQTAYEAYYSPDAKAARTAAAQAAANRAVTEAQRLFTDGDLIGARQTLFSAGISDEGIAEYLRMWRE